MISSTHPRSRHAHRTGGFAPPACVVAILLLLATGSAAAHTAGATGRGSSARPAYPHRATLTNAKLAHWAVVVHNVGAHVKPNRSSKVITILHTVTGDATQNLVLILDELDLSPSTTWYRVRLPILPNNSTGWIPASSLGTLYTVDTHLYVNRATETAVLKRNGKTIFTARVGVGRRYWPTPRGQFYVRDELTNFHNPFYGPIAFGTNARSAVLTDWPGGGFIGIHGTNTPDLIPGHISHGCIRLENAQILKLARLMKVGTPVTIT
jgi:L,D-transpeptidase catalytic domain